MAVEYLTRGVDSLAAGNWKLAGGGAGSGIVDSATLVVADGSATITNDIVWDALTEGIESLDFLPGFSGNVGSSAGPLQLDADAASTSRVTWGGPGTLYYQAKGDNNLCNNFLMTSRGRANLVAGTFTNIRMGGGVLSVSPSAVVTNYYTQGGSSTLGYNATAFTTLDIDGGVHTVNRPCATINVRSGTLVYDVTTAESTSATITVWQGATLRLLSARATIATVNLYGTLDAQNLRTPVTLTATNVGPRFRVIPSSKLTYTPVYQFLPMPA